MISDEYAGAVADFVVDNGLAVVWSQRIDGDDPDAGKKGRQGWQLAKPWAKANRDGLVAQLQSYYGKRNLLVVTQESNVVTVDCDTAAGLDLYLSLNLPNTVTISTGRDGGGFHFILRPPPIEEIGKLAYTFFELSGEKDEPKVSGAARTKLHVLAGLHKTGRRYRLVKGNGLKIAEMTHDAYATLAEGYGYTSYKTRADVAAGVRVPHPGRHDYLVSRASDYLYLGIRGAALEAHLKVDWDFGCEVEPVDKNIDSFIARLAASAEQRWEIGG